MDRLQILLYVTIIIATFIIGIFCGIEWGYQKKELEYESQEEEQEEKENKNKDKYFMF